MTKHELPWPPSINHYWRTVMIGRAPRVLISKEGRKYREAVRGIAATKRPLTGRLSVYIAVFPPDRRKRDLDNLPKAILDALTYAGVWQDDSQIDSITIVRQRVLKGGVIRIVIEEIESEGEAA